MATMAMASTEMEQVQMRPSARRAANVAKRNRDLFERQRPLRRGPTPEMYFAKHIDNSRLVKGDDLVRRREMRLFTLVMSVMTVLTLVYVWQHFSAIDVGYKVEAQKQQVELLREENRKLRLDEAKLTDPGRIDREARELGMSEPLPGQVIRDDAADGTVLAKMQTPAQATGFGN